MVLNGRDAEVYPCIHDSPQNGCGNENLIWVADAQVAALAPHPVACKGCISLGRGLHCDGGIPAGLGLGSSSSAVQVSCAQSASVLLVWYQGLRFRSSIWPQCCLTLSNAEGCCVDT